MDLKTYNALMGAGSIYSSKGKTAIEFDFSIQAKMQFEKISGEEAIKQTAQERLVGMITAFLTSLFGMFCCFILVLQKEENDLALLTPLLLGQSPLLFSCFFSKWWHKNKVIYKKEE
jgi:hypothetical protein